MSLPPPPRTSGHARPPRSGHITVIPIITVTWMLTIALAGSVSAQSTMGGFRGIVTDETGGALPGATVTLQNDRTGATQVTTTDERGRYAFLSLPAAPYTLTVELSGFAVATHEGLELAVSQTIDQWVNRDAFAEPKPGPFGDLGRNTEYGPSFAQVDLSLMKNARVGLSQTLQLRVEVFNIFNRPNFDNPTAEYRNETTFGQVLNTFGRTIGLGTPRQIQLGLKYTF